VARRYPLAPLLEVRRERVEKKAVERRAAGALREERVLVERAAREKREGTERAALAERAGERKRLEGGSARVQDLQQAERYRVGTAERVGSLKAREREATERVRTAKRTELEVQASLVHARAEAKAAEEHARRFRRTEERAEERAEEETALDHWSASRRGARRG
jgi:hypothetical protein